MFDFFLVCDALSNLMIATQMQAFKVMEEHWRPYSQGPHVLGPPDVVWAGHGWLGGSCRLAQSVCQQCDWICPCLTKVYL